MGWHQAVFRAPGARLVTWGHLIVATGVAAVIVHGAGPARAVYGTPVVQVAQLAPNGAPGIVNSLALGEVALDRSISVTPFDDDELSLAIQARFEDELRRAGRPLTEEAALTLSFETRVIQGRFSKTPGNMGRFEGNSGEMRLDLNIWSTGEDSLLGGRQSEEPRQANLFHMNVVLRERSTGKTLWLADAYCEMLTSDSERIGASMVAPLVASLGRGVKQLPFDIE